MGFYKSVTVHCNKSKTFISNIGKICGQSYAKLPGTSTAVTNDQQEIDCVWHISDIMNIWSTCRMIMSTQLDLQPAMEPSVLLLLANFVAFALANFCPFPGIPKNGYGVNFHDNSEQFRHFFNWGARQYFEEGEIIQFRCEEGWATTLSKESEDIKCLSDGTWNATLPKCGNSQSCFLILLKFNI